jgi:hypothetical protein
MRNYPFGKTPLTVRVERYVHFFRPRSYIPLHPDEYWELADTREGQKLLGMLRDMYMLPIVPIGLGGGQ